MSQSEFIGAPPNQLPSASAARVRVQIFPLQADRAQLEEFCERWFNQKIHSTGILFRPALPIVFCTVLTYEDMGDIDRWRSGVYSQNEVYFLLLLDRYRWSGTKVEFVEHSVTTPYIFVDDPTSVAVGKERFGFPKQFAEFSSGVTDAGVPWPADATGYLNVKTWLPSRNGRRLEPLLEIYQNPRSLDSGFDLPGAVRVPARPAVASRSDILWWLQTLVGEVRARARPGPIADTPGALTELAEALRNGIAINAYNLRQIPHQQWLNRSRYRDLIRFRMRLRMVHNFRFFDERFGAGSDWSVIIHRRGILPIVERLGLRVAERQRRPGPDGTEVADVIQAVAPVYTQVDFVLESGNRLCWQFDRHIWHVRGEERPSGDHVIADPEHIVEGDAPVPEQLDADHAPDFDGYLGASSAIFYREQTAPPVRDVKYLMLPGAERETSAYLQKVVPEGCPLRFRPISVDGLVPIRLLLTRARERTDRRDETLVWMDGRYLSISVPITYEFGGDQREALLLLHNFAENPMTIEFQRLVYAGPTHRGEFDAPWDWFGPTQRTAQHYALDTNMLIRSGIEARFETCRWLDILSEPRDVAGTVDADWDGLQTLFTDRVARISPMIVIGGVRDSENPRRWVEQRVTLANLSSEVHEDCRVLGPERRFWVRIRATADYGLVRDLGIREEPRDFPVPTNRNFPAGPIDSIPVVAVAEAAEQVTLQNLETLWWRRGGAEPFQVKPGFGSSFWDDY